MTFVLTGWMLYTMWVLFGLMGLSFLLGLYRALVDKKFSSSLVLDYLKDVLYYVLPLFVLANVVSLDYTGYLLLGAYYVGAFGVALKYLGDMKKKLL
ncbi:hypothetical protein [Paenibacillus terrigena]|uniref:hypothetical protein n=1 Tax=Paenibacillus terrigena TaxID=369333 RepID=UPI0003684853|nr:hypothetical protein [Paenibacillus terrigena]